MTTLSNIFQMIEASAELLEVEAFAEIFLNDLNSNSIETLGSRIIVGTPSEVLETEIELGYLVVWYLCHAGRIEIHNFSRSERVTEYLTLVSPPFRDRFCDNLFLLDQDGLLEYELECLSYNGDRLKFDPESDLDFPALWEPDTAKLTWKYGK